MRHIISYYIGILIIFLSHVLMLISPKSVCKTETKAKIHAVMNIVGMILVAYYFMYKEG